MEQDDIGAVEQRLAQDAADAADMRLGIAFVSPSDLVAILREFAALRRAYEQRGEALQRIGSSDSLCCSNSECNRVRAELFRCRAVIDGTREWLDAVILRDETEGKE